ncbi:MAG TPA: hypothetical protein VFO39_16785 [Candidatus Sulfotelmatobacter sp.]|nr:hypothetical protein [Candidatus Sulfotelmatobacter sp.]
MKNLRESEIFKLMTAGAEFVRESEWSYIYQKRNRQFHVSKFLDEDFAIDAKAFCKRWPQMSSDERLVFCGMFAQRTEPRADDTQTLNPIIEDGNDRLWTILALKLLNHPDRERVVTFLISRLQDPLLDRRGGILNYFQALGMAGEPGCARY